MNTKRCISSSVVTFILFLLSTNAFGLEEIVVISEQLFKDTTAVSPTSTITAEQLLSLNIATVEDALANEPSLIVRRRYIGDPNGVIGIRGSNMFQTARTLVFVDGMPLHYHLQTRFSGSPRWSLVSPGEIDKVEVVYGPFSAEYSGNAIGGVINISTKTPTEEKITLEGTLFSQEYDIFTTDERYNGGKLFASYENVFGDLAVFFSYNHLENESQPLFQRAARPLVEGGRIDAATIAAAPIAQEGAFEGLNNLSQEVVYFGDSGSEEATTDLFKIKLNYNHRFVQLRGSIAYEDRKREEFTPNNFLRDANGNTIYDRFFRIPDNLNAVYDTTAFGTSVFQNRFQDRESLLVGAGASFSVNDWLFDAYYSDFSILDDTEIRTGADRDDPNFAAANASFRARRTQFDDTGWQIFDIKAGTDQWLGNNSARLSIGYHFDDFSLAINPENFNSITNTVGSSRGGSGGDTTLNALYTQFGYRFNDYWDLVLGLRYDYWKAKNGFVEASDRDRSSGADQDIFIPERTESGFSPKFSIAYFPNERWSFRYSLARALRFALVEELFRNEDALSGQGFVADASLAPEDGIHHNVSINKALYNGSITINVFRDIIDETIFNFVAQTPGGSISTALPVDQVETNGIEFIYTGEQVLGTRFDVRYNIAYIDAQITQNRLNPEIIGNQFPRIPYWRSHLNLNYPVHDKVDLSASVRFASDSFGELDNSDNEDNVFAAHDAFLFLNLKARWQIQENANVSLGVDNVTNKEAYVFHPWPFRTVFLEGKVTF